VARKCAGATNTNDACAPHLAEHLPRVSPSSPSRSVLTRQYCELASAAAKSREASSAGRIAPRATGCYHLAHSKASQPASKLMPSGETNKLQTTDGLIRLASSENAPAAALETG
jgi:hypothetical protein